MFLRKRSMGSDLILNTLETRPTWKICADCNLLGTGYSKSMQGRELVKYITSALV
jgi:hypothetical protein